MRRCDAKKKSWIYYWLSATLLLCFPGHASAELDYDPESGEWNGLDSFVTQARSLGLRIDVQQELDYATFDAETSLIIVYPTVLLDQDDVDFAGRQLRIHLHGEAPAAAPPQPFEPESTAPAPPVPTPVRTHPPSIPAPEPPIAVRPSPPKPVMRPEPLVSIATPIPTASPCRIAKSVSGSSRCADQCPKSSGRASSISNGSPPSVICCKCNMQDR